MNDDDENPIVMYVIVRRSLGMSIGKTATQCMHAAQMLQYKFSQCKDEEKSNIYKEWFGAGIRKITKMCEEKDWRKIKELVNDDYDIVITDLGLTELEPLQQTCIGFWPQYKNDAPKIIKRLQLLRSKE